MLKPCPECSHHVSEKAVFCPSCGCPLTNIPSKQTAGYLPRSRMRRLPNGFGSIKKLPGRRRNPFGAYPPTEDYHDNGSPVYRKALGYFRTYNEAFEALARFNRDPYDPEMRQASFAEIYEMFIEDHFSGKELSPQSLRGYQAAFKNSSALHERPFAQIKLEEFQNVIDKCSLGHGSKELIRNLFKMMSKFALAHDIVTKDAAQFIKIKTPDDSVKGVPFKEEEIRRIFELHDTVGMILLYTGMRISELNTVERVNRRFIRGGLKTKAGKDRLIPLHPAIQDIIFPKISVQAYRKKFEENYPGHTPHDLRHTATWLMQSCGCDDLSTKMILGHSLGGDIEKNTYGHRTEEQLMFEISKLPDFRDKKSTLPIRSVPVGTIEGIKSTKSTKIS